MTPRSNVLSIRLSSAEQEWLDEVVARGAFATRSEAVHAALARACRDLREAQIARAYQRGYERHPFPANPDEEAWLDAGEQLAAELVEE